jgi:hypothetical protein
VSAPTFLPVYFERLDAGAIEEVVAMLAPDFTFAILWAADGDAHEFAGGFAEFDGYLAQRDPDGQIHHIGPGTREGRTEVVSGWTTRYGDPLGTFVFAVELNEDERCRRLFAARTPAFGGRPF